MQIYYSIDSMSVSGTTLTINGSIYQTNGTASPGLVWTFNLGSGDLTEWLVNTYDAYATSTLGIVFADGDERFWIGLGLPISFTTKRFITTSIGI